MKTFTTTLTIAMFAGALLILNSCKKEETAVSPPIPGNEVLTTVKLRFENATNANDTLWAVWKDLSDGANPPDTSKAIINLKKSTSYKASVYFSDETKTPASDITATIKARANYHSYWFFKTGAIADNLSIAATDFDTNSPPLPVGLENNFVTSATTGTGRLEGVLRHQPNSKNGTYTPGSTDSDVFFTLNIIP